MPATLAAYFERFGFQPPAIAAPPPPGLELVVAIPCHDEPDLPRTLDSLRACAPPPGGVEVLVVVNGAAGDPPAVRARNGETLRRAEGWARRHDGAGLRLHLIAAPDLPDRQAGVGLARKIAMDEAAARLHAAGNPAGVIACLDADCTVAPTYLTALAAHFREHPASDACAVAFAHQPGAAGDAATAAGIVRYELFLRCYTLGLRLAGYPFAFHTLGSCMAVRAEAYLRQGGMNRRQAGEDFYFLNKFMTLGTCSALEATTVFPSGRASHRVPFGTGRAMTRWLRDGDGALEAYDPRVFAELGVLLERVAAFGTDSPAGVEGAVAALPPAVRAFLAESSFPGRLAEIRRNSATPAAFQKRFFRWCDRFRVLKYVHLASERYHPRVPVTEAARELLRWAGVREPPEGPEALLEVLRRVERESATAPAGEIPITQPEMAGGLRRAQGG